MRANIGQTGRHGQARTQTRARAEVGRAGERQSGATSGDRVSDHSPVVFGVAHASPLLRNYSACAFIAKS